MSKRTDPSFGNRSTLVLFTACFVLGVFVLALIPSDKALARGVPYDFNTLGGVSCNYFTEFGDGKASVSSNPSDGSLQVSLKTSPDLLFQLLSKLVAGSIFSLGTGQSSVISGAEGQAGVGVKFTAPQSGRIKIDADVVITGSDALAEYTPDLPIADLRIQLATLTLDAITAAYLQSGVEIQAYKSNATVGYGSYTEFQNESEPFLQPDVFAPPLYVNPRSKSYANSLVRDSAGLPPALELDVAAGEEFLICVGVRSKVKTVAIQQLLANAGVDYRSGTKVNAVRINYISEESTSTSTPPPSPSPTPSPTPETTCIGPWSVGQRVLLKKGAEIRQGSGSTYAIHTIVPEDNWPVDVIGGPRCIDGYDWWDISRTTIDGGGTGWIRRLQAITISTPTTSSTASYSGPEPPSYAPSFAGQTVSWNGNNFRSDDGKTWIFQGSDAERAAAEAAVKARELAEAEARAQDAGVYLQKSNLLELFMDINKNASDYGLRDAEYVIIRGPYKATIYSDYRGGGSVVGIYSGEGTYKLPATTIGSVRAEVILPPAPDPLPEVSVPPPTPISTSLPPPGQSVSSFTLINADTDQAIAAFDPMADGATIDLQSLPTRNLSIRANTNPQTVGSVKFGFDGNVNYRIESSPPYAIAGDSSGNYAPWTPAIGSHAVVATPYTDPNAGGTAGAAFVNTFTVTDSSTSTQTPTPSPSGYSGQYFDNQTLSGTPKLTRNDTAINFDWGGGTPDASIPIDHFSVRWTKTETFTAGDYQFSMTGDDGIRLYIDNVLVIDKWIDQGPTTYKATKTLFAGDHTIKMEYYENGGGAVAKLSYQAVAVSSTTSTSQTVIPQGASWKYLDTNTRPAGWEALALDDSAWKSGSAELGYGDGDEAKVVGYGPDAGNKYITTYFRKTFSVTNAPGYSNLNLRIKRDDGAVVYLNGTEVFRNNMPAGAISHSTLAASAIDDSVFYSTSVSASLLREGTNMVAVEVHQAGGSSSDVSFDLSFTADVQTVSSAPAPVPAPTSECGELLPTPWHLEGINAQEKYQSIASTALQGKANLKITYNLHGLKALGGDASAIIFDQSGWRYISLSNYGQNGLNGAQTVTIPLSAFGLNLSQSVGTLHTRFWYSSNFVVDISSIAACS